MTDGPVTRRRVRADGHVLQGHAVASNDEYPVTVLAVHLPFAR
ncbi:hypothetical protein [Halobacterium zhouii]|nr:hypothetical protein [Halobacterium zhouii]